MQVGQRVRAIVPPEAAVRQLMAAQPYGLLLIQILILNLLLLIKKKKVTHEKNILFCIVLFVYFVLILKGFIINYQDNTKYNLKFIHLHVPPYFELDKYVLCNK